MGTVLSVSGLTKTYEVRKTVFSLKKDQVRAVDHVSLSIHSGKTLGVVGESGSGKSTLARCITLLEEPDEGKVIFMNRDWIGMTETDRKPIRRNMQIIFQDPYSSLNPRKRVFDIISEPMLVHGMADRTNIRERTLRVVKSVGLDEDFLPKYPHEMSGGQRQRVAIGRALGTNPSFLIADEPVSSVDVSVQAQIINLFLDIKDQSTISMLFISHDLNIVRFVSDDIMVMYRGTVVEKGEKNTLFLNPLHPYTAMLIGNEEERQASVEQTVGNGCVFFPRCPRRLERCRSNVPPQYTEGDQEVSCFLYAP